MAKHNMTISQLTLDFIDYKFTDTVRRFEEEGLQEMAEKRMKEGNRPFQRGSSIRDENENFLYFIVYMKQALYVDYMEEIQVLTVEGRDDMGQEKMFLTNMQTLEGGGILLEYCSDSLASKIQAEEEEANERQFAAESDYWDDMYYHYLGVRSPYDESCRCGGAGACIECNPRLFI